MALLSEMETLSNYQEYPIYFTGSSPHKVWKDIRTSHDLLTDFKKLMHDHCFLRLFESDKQGRAAEPPKRRALMVFEATTRPQHAFTNQTTIVLRLGCCVMNVIQSDNSV